MKDQIVNGLDTPMNRFGAVPSKSSTAAPGRYDEGPIGPKGGTSALPLKFYDDAIKVNPAPREASMDFVPAKTMNAKTE